MAVGWVLTETVSGSDGRVQLHAAAQRGVAVIQPSSIT
jgi:hypothetical protein